MELGSATEVQGAETQLKTVLIADDKEFWRDWIQEELKKEFPQITRFTVVSKGTEALSRAIAEKPSLITLDIEFKNETDHGIKVAEKIWQSHKSAAIMICSNHADETYVRSLYKVKPEEASYAYILKDNAATYLRKAVTSILDGDCFIDPDVDRVIRKLEHPEYNLTQGEYEALVCATLGYTDETAGKLLHIGDRAMQARLRSVYAKFGIPDKKSADAGVLNPRSRSAWLALKRGLISINDLKGWAEEFHKKATESGIPLDLR